MAVIVVDWPISIVVGSAVSPLTTGGSFPTEIVRVSVSESPRASVTVSVTV